METNFIKELIARAHLESWVIMENGGANLCLKFKQSSGTSDEQNTKLFMAELFDEIFHRHLKIKTFSFKLKNKEGSEFIFDINNLDTSSSCATKIGTLSLYLSRGDVIRLKKESGQINNSAHKVATFAFNPDDLQDQNYTIFYTRDLLSCTIYSPN